MIHKEDNEMKFKKVAALVLASAMTLGLAACGNGNSSTPSQSSLFVGHHLQQRH